MLNSARWLVPWWGASGSLGWAGRTEGGQTGIWPGLAPATPEILMLQRTEMASPTLTSFPAASRARYARWTSTCGIRPPGFGGRPRGRLPPGAAEIERGSFFTMPPGTITVIRNDPPSHATAAGQVSILITVIEIVRGANLLSPPY